MSKQQGYKKDKNYGLQSEGDEQKPTQEPEVTKETSQEEVAEDAHLPSSIEFVFVKKFFYLQFTINLLMMFDMGILPATTVKMQKELGMANNTFGMLGSFVYLGQVVGSMMATCFLQTKNTKLVLCMCILLNIIFLVTFTFTRRPSAMMAFRCLTGFFQVFMWIYFPVWADFFGNEEQKSSWLSILIVSSPLGNILGYVLAAAIQDGLGWRWCFYIQAMMMLPTSVGILIIPGKYMDLQKTGKLIRDFQTEKENQERLQSIDSKQPKLDEERLEEHLSKVIDLRREDGSIPDGLAFNEEPFYPAETPSFQKSRAIENQIHLQGSFVGRFSIQDAPANNPPSNRISRLNTSIDDGGVDLQEFLRGLKLVLSNCQFVRMCLSLTVLYFVITGIQFWMSDYFITELNAPKARVFLLFGVISITGPVLGVIMGGRVVAKLGGYNAKKSLYVIIIVSMLASCCSIPIGFLHESDDYKLVSGLLWLLLFGGGFVLPCATGIMLNTVKEEHRTTANSIANIWCNLLGFLPAPYVYGLIADSGAGHNKKLAMRWLMFMPILSCMFITWAAYYVVRGDTSDKSNTRECSESSPASKKEGDKQ